MLDLIIHEAWEQLLSAVNVRFTRYVVASDVVASDDRPEKRLHM